MPLKKAVRKTSSSTKQVGASPPPPPPPPSSSPSSRVSFSNTTFVKEFEVEEEFADEDISRQEQGTAAELFVAAKAGDVFALQRVLATIKVPVDMRDYTCRGRTALSFVAEKDKVECIKLLLSYGASAYVLDDDGLTPLKYYASVREPEVGTWSERPLSPCCVVLRSEAHPPDLALSCLPNTTQQVQYLTAMVLSRPVVEDAVVVACRKETPSTYHGEAPLPPSLPTMTAASRPPVPSLPQQQQQYENYGYIPPPPLPELLPPSIRTSFIGSRTSSSHFGESAVQQHVLIPPQNPHTSLSSFFPSY